MHKNDPLDPCTVRYRIMQVIGLSRWNAEVRWDGEMGLGDAGLCKGGWRNVTRRDWDSDGMRGEREVRTLRIS